MFDWLKGLFGFIIGLHPTTKQNQSATETLPSPNIGCMLTSAQLKLIMPHCPDDKAALYLPHLNSAMAEANINSKLRMAAFISQCAHESCELKFMHEIWGPTTQQLKYDPPNQLATQLGNTKIGDGHTYLGRSPLQLTGKANYIKCGNALGLDLVNNPELAVKPDITFRVSCWFWTVHDLNALADKGDFVIITKRINGGTTGLQSRLDFYNKALSVIS